MCTTPPRNGFCCWFGLLCWGRKCYASEPHPEPFRCKWVRAQSCTAFPEARALSHFSCVLFWSQPRLASSLVHCSVFFSHEYFSCSLKGSDAEAGYLSLRCWTASCVLLRMGRRLLRQWAWALVCPLGQPRRILPSSIPLPLSDKCHLCILVTAFGTGGGLGVDHF